MAGFQPTRSRVGFFADDSDDIDDWMAQRKAEVAARDAAEAAGREAWARGIESGNDLDASTPHDLIRLGQHTLANAGDSAGRDDSSPASPERLGPAQPDGPLLGPASGNLAASEAQTGTFIGETRRLTPLQPRPNPAGRPRLPTVSPSSDGSRPDDLATRLGAYGEGYLGGLVPGVARGGLHATQGLGDGARLSLQMTDPVRRLLGHSALEPLEPFALGVVGGLADAAQDPRAAWNKVEAAGERIARGTIPFAAPLPATREGARQQGRRVGMNHGEIGFNIAAIPLGGEAAEGLEAAALRRSALDAAGYERRGIPPKIASYFAEPYPTRAMGSHWFSRDATWPAFLGGGKLPPWFIESRYNVWKPATATRGQVAEHHYINDVRFGGGPLPDARGKASGWSGKRLEWEKNPQLLRFIERMPAVTKGTLVGSGLVGLDAAQAGGQQP